MRAPGSFFLAIEKSALTDLILHGIFPPSVPLIFLEHPPTRHYNNQDGLSAGRPLQNDSRTNA